MKKIRITKKDISLLPGYGILTLWVIFTVVLLSWVFAASFSTTQEIFKGQNLKFPTGLHFENYIDAWKSQNVSVFFANSVIYSTVSTVLLVVVCAPASYALSRFRFKGNAMIQRCLVAAMGVPIIMIILPLFGIVTKLDLMNHDLSVRCLLIFLYVGTNIPFTIIFLLSFFATLSRTFEEAAAIDGCTQRRAFWQVMLPLAQPGIITVSIFNFIKIWNEYFISLIFANSDKQRPVAVGLFSMINSMMYTGNWAGLFAAVVIVFMPTFIIYIFLSEKIIEGATGGAIKG